MENKKENIIDKYLNTKKKKYQQKVLGIEAVVLPSTSPANAAYSLDRLIGIWSGTINI